MRVGRARGAARADAFNRWRAPPPALLPRAIGADTARIANYRKAYTTLDPEGEDSDKSFIQSMGLGKTFFVSRPQGVLEMRIVR